MRLFLEGHHVWSGFQAKETPRKAAVPREQVAAQTRLCPVQCQGLGEKKPSVVFRRKDALGLLFVPKES